MRNLSTRLIEPGRCLLRLSALWLLAPLVAGCGAGSAGELDRPTRGEAPRAAPNIVVVVTDDQTAEQFTRGAMPATHRFLVDEGVEFTNSIVTTPLCCPSRASFLTGQYDHNNGVLSNTYMKLRDKANVLPAWLQHRGYRTAHVGKYLNNYAKSLDDETAATPGWDDWFTVLEPERYSDYSISDNGKVLEFGERPRDHLTRVLNDRAVETVERLAPRREPFYLQLDHHAPHAGMGNSGGGCPGGAAPERRDRGRVPDAKLPPKDSFDGPVEGKSSFLRGLPPLEKREKERTRARWRCALESIAGVDRGIRRIVTALRRTGELDDTAIVFTSDNGYFFGEHRIAKSKHFPYEEGVRVPLAIRPPRGVEGPRGGGSAAPVANIDLAPTLLELARAEPCLREDRCRAMDGRSLVPLLKGSENRWPSGRPLLIEIDLPPSNSKDGPRPCSYRGVRTPDHVYLNYTSAGAAGRNCEETDEEELYSLADDPQQIHNLLAEGSAEHARIADRLRELTDALAQCSGRAPEPGGCP